MARRVDPSVQVQDHPGGHPKLPRASTSYGKKNIKTESNLFEKGLSCSAGKPQSQDDLAAKGMNSRSLSSLPDQQLEVE